MYTVNAMLILTLFPFIVNVTFSLLDNTSNSKYLSSIKRKVRTQKALVTIAVVFV